jgi:HEAT repeat protein
VLPLTGQDALLATLIVVVAILFVVTLIFSSYAVALRLRGRARDVRRERFAERWREPLLAAVADPDAIAALRACVRKQERIHFVGFAVQYARRLRGDGRSALRAIVAPYLGLVAERADSPRVEVRARAIQTLGLLGLPDHAPMVVAALDDPSPLVAMVAARSLAHEETPEYAPDVLARLSRFQGWNRRFLASMLAAMGPLVSATLRGGLANSTEDPGARAVLADALLLQGDPLAGDVAAAVLETTEDRELLVAALRLLHAVGRTQHAAAVRRYLAAPDEIVRAQALRALGAVGTESDVPTLLDAMADTSPWVSLSAARGALDAGAEALVADRAASEGPTGAVARQALAEVREVA